MRQLVIENFGVIKHLSIELKKVTVFIGPQGSGKSTVARLYTALSWIDKSLIRGNLKRSDLDKDHFRAILEHVQIDYLLTDLTFIEYRGDSFILRYEGGKVSVRGRRQAGEYRLPKVLYIPSERSYLCISDEILSVNNLPSVLYELASDYTIARARLEEKGFDLPINDFHFSYSENDSSSLISDKDGTYKVKLNQAASGIQSVLPLALVFSYYLDCLQYKVQNRRSILSVQQKLKVTGIYEQYSISPAKKINPDCPEHNVLLAAGISQVPAEEETYSKLIEQIHGFIDFRLSAIIEEPEQNLFPLAQKSLVEYLIKGINSSGSSLLMTTHSPYVLASINNLIFAGENNSLEGVNEIVAEELQLKCADVSAYYFSDGGCVSIIDNELKNINPETIDSCADEINSVYSRLEEIVYGDR